MKKILLSLLIILLSVFSLSSCVGQTTPPNQGSNNNNPPSGETGDDEDDDLVTYTISLYRNGRVWYPNIDISAIYVNENSVGEAVFSQFDGTATFKGDGTYNIHLSTVPTGYTYNPNENVVDLQHTSLIIDLYPITEYEQGDGSSGYGDSGYYIEKTGYYSVTLDSASDRKYFQFLPLQAGTYVFESLNDIFEDDVDPRARLYGGTKYYYNETEDGYTLYEGGGTSLDNGYTSNFRFEWDWDATWLNTARVFAIEAENKYDTYPVTVYFRVSYLEDYQYADPFDPQVIYPEEVSSAVTPQATGTFHYLSDLNNGVLDMRNCGYDEDLGFWRMLNEDGSFGAILCAQIMKEIPALGFSIYDLVHGIGVTSPNASTEYYVIVYDENDIRICYDYFLYGDGPLLGDDGNALVYNGDNYSNYANDDGFVYVTNELMTFFQLLAENRQLFKDGYGTCENRGVSSGQNDQWLFACAYYE